MYHKAVTLFKIIGSWTPYLVWFYSVRGAVSNQTKAYGIRKYLTIYSWNVHRYLYYLPTNIQVKPLIFTYFKIFLF